jgi:hypothetical protein
LCALLAAALGHDIFLPQIVIENIVGEVVINELLKFIPIQADADPVGDFRGLRVLYPPDASGAKTLLNWKHLRHDPSKLRVN